jgi:hypothetical protein
MKLRTVIATENIPNLFQFLVNHVNYSFSDISFYEELTNEEKKLISESEFNTMFYNDL